MRRVFLDANVLFFASNRTSNIARLVDRLCGVSQVVTSELACEEAERNLRAKWPKHHAGLAPLVDRLELVQSLLFPLTVELAAKDRPILCAAIRAGCDLLATGDRKDFGHLFDQTVEGVHVVNLTRLAKLVVEQEAVGG